VRPKKKKKPTRRTDIPRPYNGGKWTEARFRSFVYSAIRRAQWPPRYAVPDRAYVKDGENPKTGRKCKLYKCEQCLKLFAKKDVQADHITPAIGVEGFQSWDLFIERLLVEENAYQVLCKACHQVKSNEEQEARRQFKKQEKEQTLPGLEYE